LNFPEALAVVWESLKAEVPDYPKYEMLVKMDEILGLSLENYEGVTEVPEVVTALLAKREKYRQGRNFEEADKVRKEIEGMGYAVSDDKLEG